VGQGNLARFGGGATTDQADIRDRMMGRAEGAHRQQGPFFLQQAADTEDLGSFDGLLEGHARQNGGDAPSQHGLARTGRADHDEIMASAGGHFHGAFGVFLSLDLAEVLTILATAAEKLFQVDAAGGDLFATGKKFNHLGEGCGADNL
jgi:hypothetical protein